MKIPPKFDEDLIKSQNFNESVIEKAITAAGALVEELHESVPTAPAEVQPSGARFFIPLAVPEGVASGDERMFEPDSITVRDLPLPLRWQIVSDEGHKGSVVVGRIDSIERVEGGWGNARGVFDVGTYGREAERLVRGKFLRGVSVDVDKFKASAVSGDDIDEEFADDSDDKSDIKNDKIKIKSARLMGITIVPMPAFQEATILIEEEPDLYDEEDDVVQDGIYEERLDEYDEELAALAASAAPVVPPREWFKNPQLNEMTPLTVDDDGRVFGHIAAWKTNHIGLPPGTKPPRSASQYAYFRTGVLRTTEGDVQVGQLTLAGGHANMSFSAKEAVEHYDNTSSAVADVIAGEDEFGIYVAGALRPDVTPAQVRAFRASAPSGDWRPINNRLELVAVCSVNVPGFPVPRAILASAGGQVTALVAAGAAPLAELREDQRYKKLEERIAKMEFAAIEKRKAEILSRFSDFEKKEESEVDNLKAMAAAAIGRMEPPAPALDAELAAKVEALKARFNN